MNSTLTAALKEAYAVAPTNLRVFETLEIRHDSIEDPIYIVQDFKPLIATLETAEEVTFLPVWFNFNLPTASESGRQDLSLTIDNVYRAISDFISLAKDYATPVQIIYRPYLSNDLTQPQLDPPLSLILQDVQITMMQVSGRATFADVINKKWPTEYYTRARFPSLGN